MTHIAIVGPIATEYIMSFLWDPKASLPRGYFGAPFMATLIGELLRRGHRVSAFTTSSDMPVSGDTWVASEGERFRIHYCSARPRAFRLNGGHLGRAIDFFSLERACLKKALLAAKPDVVHAHWCYEFGLSAIESGLPYVVTCHDAPHLVLRYMRSLYRAVRYLMARRCLKKARVVTAVSPFLQAELQPYCSARISVVPNPLPEEMSAETALSEMQVRDAMRPVIAMVTNGWGVLKNAEPAFRAFQLLRTEVPGAQLRVYGVDFGPGEKAEIWSHEQEIHHGIVFCGRTEHRTLLARLREADVLLHPSLLESCPMAVAEAMALGIPVVGGACSGGVPWMIDAGGILVDVSSPQEIAKGIRALLGGPDTYSRCARAAVTRAREVFSVRSVTDSWEALYFNTVRSGSGLNRAAS